MEGNTARSHLRTHFEAVLGRAPQLALAKTVFKDRKEVSEILTRMEEASALFDTKDAFLRKPDTKQKLVKTKEGIDFVFDECRRTGICAMDVETTGFDHRTDQVVSFQISPAEGISYYFPFRHKEFEGNLDYDYCMDKMAELHADPNTVVVWHNGKFDIKFWVLRGQDKFVNCRDTMIMAHLLNENRPGGVGLKDLTANDLGYKMIKFKDLGIWEKHKIYKPGLLRDFSELGILKAMAYACLDTDFTLRLHNKYWPEMAASNMRVLFEFVEMPLVYLLTKMELKGIKVDPAYLHTLEEPFSKDVEELAAKIELAAAALGYENAPDKKGIVHPFNPRSPQQMVKFTEYLGLDTNKRSKTISARTGRPMNTMVVDKKAREVLASSHPIYRLINIKSDKQKALDTYIIPLQHDHIHPITQRVHPSYNQAIVETGRLSSKNPNIQNISRKESGFGNLIRKAFIPEPGYLFVRADYSQVELRIAAHLFKCKPLIDTLLSGDDIHSQIAMRTFSLDKKFPGLTVAQIKDHPDKEIQEYRYRAKAVSFGILYGTTKYGLSKNLGISEDEAQAMIDRFLDAFPEIRSGSLEIIRWAGKNGYVQTLLKRRRRFPYDEQGRRRYGWDRAAVNTPVQGSAADVMKWAMLNIDEGLQGLDAHLLAQIHDEVLVESKIEIVDDVVRIVRERMEDGLNHFNIKLAVPLLVDVDVQDAWGVNVWRCSICNNWSIHAVPDELDKKKLVRKCDNCNA